MTEKTVVPLYKEKCAICTYMNPRATKTFGCHYSKGNEMCPAKEFIFSVGFSVPIFAKRYKEASFNGDVDKVQAVLAKVKEQPTTVQQQFWNDAIAEIAKNIEFVEAPVAPEDAVAETQQPDLTGAQEGTQSAAEDWTD